MLKWRVLRLESPSMTEQTEYIIEAERLRVTEHGSLIFSNGDSYDYDDPYNLVATFPSDATALQVIDHDNS